MQCFRRKLPFLSFSCPIQGLKYKRVFQFNTRTVHTILFLSLIKYKEDLILTGLTYIIFDKSCIPPVIVYIYANNTTWWIFINGGSRMNAMTNRELLFITIYILLKIKLGHSYPYLIACWICSTNMYKWREWLRTACGKLFTVNTN